MINELSKPYLVTKEKWESIYNCKNNFIKGIESSLDNPYIRPQIKESWIRCKNNGINPYSRSLGERLTEEEYQNIKIANQLLIDAAEPLMESFNSLSDTSAYALSLKDQNGVILAQKGDRHFVKLIQNSIVTEGVRLDEDNCGTSTHSLVMIHQCPVQLITPEVYCKGLSEGLTSAAPIFNKYGELIGTLLLLIDESGRKPNWEDLYDYHQLQVHALGWVTSMAQAIEKQMQLHQQLISLTTLNNTLEATMTFVDEGIIMLDEKGGIIRSNQEAIKILGIPDYLEKGVYLKDFLKPNSDLMALILSGSNINYIEESMKYGAKDHPFVFSSRPVLNSQKFGIKGAVVRFTSSKKMSQYLVSRDSIAHFTFDQIIGQSDEIKDVKEIALQFASSPENILLTGESGTGKELFAQSIHNASRPQGPFIALNCASIPRNLIESELFGYEGGSFTGAERKGRPGKFELANSGTLFLDEIGDMPFELQGVLLRVLEDKQVMRIGGDHYQHVDFRLIAATNHDLSQLVEDKLFRADLYYRLSSLSINIPPLRERNQDILMLAEHFKKEYCFKMAWQEPSMSLPAKKLILNYNWPGNVRQLEKAMVYAATTAKNGIIEVENFPPKVRDSFAMNLKENSTNEFPLSMQEAEILTIRKALRFADNNMAQAANILGIGKSTIYKKIKELNIAVKDS
ncbi:MAG: sigma 54-interacting transcriptional regulator [Dehalobacterium sp.]